MDDDRRAAKQREFEIFVQAEQVLRENGDLDRTTWCASVIRDHHFNGCSQNEGVECHSVTLAKALIEAYQNPSYRAFRAAQNRP